MHLVLGFSDQVPLWIKKGSEKEVFAKFESSPESINALRQKLRKHMDEIAKGEIQVSKVQEIVMPQPNAEGQKQLRSRKDTHSDRYRITYEARQIVRGYLSADLNYSAKQQH